MSGWFHKICLVCNGTNIHALHGYERHDLLKCADGGFVFMRKTPTNKELEEYYTVYAYEKEKQFLSPQE